MVQTRKFSEFADGGDLTKDNTTVGLESGVNTKFNNPWPFLPPGTTADRPAPSSEINFRLRFNTDLEEYEYYSPTLVDWIAIEDAANILPLLASHAAGEGASLIGLEDQGTIINKTVQDLSEASVICQTNNGTFLNAQYLDLLASGVVGVTTATGVLASRILTGTANQIDIANGDASADPTFSLSSTIDAPGTFTIQSSTVIDSIIDDDTMATATDTNIPTSESVVAYIASTPGGAGGANTEIQYNNAGALAGISSFTFDGTDSIFGNGAVFDEIGTPPTPSANTAKLYAFDQNGITRLGVVDSTDVIVTVDGDVIYVVRNTSGITINKGEAVYVSGATGTTPDVALAQADSLSTMPSLGLAFEDIANNDFGRIITKGIIDGIDTSAFAAGERVYVSTTVAGALVNSRPLHPDLQQQVGIVVVSGVGNGRIEVDNLTALGDELGTRQNSFAIGDGAAGTKSLIFTNADTLTLQANPTGARVVTLPDATTTLTGTNITNAGYFQVDNLRLDTNDLSSTSGDVSISPASGQAFDVNVIGGGGISFDFTGAGNFDVNLDSGLFILDGSTGVDAVLDEDNMASDSATALATQQSIKAYVDGLSYLNTMTNGQLIIGRTGMTPTFSTLTAGTGISISNASGSITISGSGGGYSWTEVTGTTQNMSTNNGYIANNGALVTLTLPASAVIGDTVIVQGKGAGGWRIAQNAGQTINFGASPTTTGVGGYLESTNQYDSVELLCITANTDWAVLTAPQGALTVN